jgi:hypothetical protein
MLHNPTHITRMWPGPWASYTCITPPQLEELPMTEREREKEHPHDILLFSYVPGFQELHGVKGIYRLVLCKDRKAWTNAIHKLVEIHT